MFRLCLSYITLVIINCLVSSSHETSLIKRAKAADVCGVSVASGSKIVGGEQSIPGAWPWQALFLTLKITGYTFTCGGTLIAPKWVVTAAHCTIGQSPVTIHIRLGAYNKEQVETHAKEFAVAEIIDHPGYNPNAYEYDISLVKLAGEVTYTDYVIPACLPQQGSDVTVGLDCWITGWGDTKNPLQSQDILRQATVPILSNDQCQAWYNTNGITIFDNQVCAGYKNGGINVCQGDSGGPLVCQDNSFLPFVLQGVTSFARVGCAGYGVYTRVSEFVTWINDTMNNNNNPDPFFSIPITPCGSVISSNQIVRLPVDNETQLYHPNMTCTWKVFSESGTLVSLTFLGRFTTEAIGYSCVDFVRITDHAGNHIITNICGYNFPYPINILLNGNSVIDVTFISNSINEFEGFAMHVRFLNQIVPTQISTTSDAVQLKARTNYCALWCTILSFAFYIVVF